MLPPSLRRWKRRCERQTAMSDKPLRIRTAEWLGWVEQERETFPWYKDESRIVTAITYARGDYRGIAYLVDGDKTEWEHCWDMPDYPRDLGACAEVLEAIEARHKESGWYLSIAYAYLDPGYTVTIWAAREIANYKGRLGHATAPTLPEALCEAFCRAVEGE